MIDQAVLDLVMEVELGLLMFSVVVFFVHGVWLFVQSRRSASQLGMARTSLVRVLSGDTPPVSDLSFLRDLPRGVKTRVFLEISQSLTGDAKDRLKFAAQEIGLVDTARGYCRDPSWRYRLRGARLLTNLEVRDDLVKDLLADTNAGVRAQAAEWAASQPVAGVIDVMMDLLADPDTLSRFAVQDSLARMGRIIATPLIRYLENNSGAAAAHGLELAEAVAEVAFLPAGIQHSHAGEPHVRIAAANLLGAIGGDESSTRLTAMLEDEEGDVRASAARALGKMRYWVAAAQLARMLSDEVWSVRREAAMALRRIGGPGVLLLRKIASGPEERAAGIAQLILDTPLQVK